MSVRDNALDQALDIAGSLTKDSSMSLGDEPNNLGAPLSGQSGSSATVGAPVGGVATITGLTGMTAESIGGFLTLSGAASPGNNGTFLIVAHNSATSVDIANAAADGADANNGSINWVERNPYSLEDDINFIRTDRAAIKGVAYSADIPIYERPSAVGTTVPANLNNLAGQSLDAKAWTLNRKFENATVAATDTDITIADAGQFPHADAVDRRGVPVQDGADAANLDACYVEIINPATGQSLTVQGGGNAGQRIFGVTRAGSSVDGDSVEVHFYSLPEGDPLALTNTYTWEATQPTSIDLYYGYRSRGDEIPDTGFRTTLVNGIVGDAGLSGEVSNLRKVISESLTSSATDLSGLLTNTGNYFPFVDLPDATPSVVEALNTLNEQVGNRDYTAGALASVPGMADGQSITATLEALAIAVGSANVTRVIERLTSAIPAGTPHSIPGITSYTLDPTNNGAGLWVFWRGVLRSPGPVGDGNDYEETSITQITPYRRIRNGDHVNYFKVG